MSEGNSFPQVNGYTGFRCMGGVHGGHEGAPKRGRHRGRRAGGGTSQGGKPEAAIPRAAVSPLESKRQRWGRP